MTVIKEDRKKRVTKNKRLHLKQSYYYSLHPNQQNLTVKLSHFQQPQQKNRQNKQIETLQVSMKKIRI